MTLCKNVLVMSFIRRCLNVNIKVGKLYSSLYFYCFTAFLSVQLLIFSGAHSFNSLILFKISMSLMILLTLVVLILLMTLMTLRTFNWWQAVWFRAVVKDLRISAKMWLWDLNWKDKVLFVHKVLEHNEALKRN